MRTSSPTPKYFICSLTTQAARQMVAYYNRVLAPLGLTSQQMMALGILWREENLSLGVFAKRAGIGQAADVSMIKWRSWGWSSGNPIPRMRVST